MLESPETVTRTEGLPAMKCGDRHLLPWRIPGVSCQNPWLYLSSGGAEASDAGRSIRNL